MQAAAPASAALRRLWQDPWASPLAQQQFAGFASEAGGKGTAGDEGRAAAAEDAGTSGSEEEQPTVEQLTADLQEREKAIEELQTKVGVACARSCMRRLQAARKCGARRS